MPSKLIKTPDGLLRRESKTPFVLPSGRVVIVRELPFPKIRNWSSPLIKTLSEAEFEQLKAAIRRVL